MVSENRRDDRGISPRASVGRNDSTTNARPYDRKGNVCHDPQERPGDCNSNAGGSAGLSARGAAGFLLWELGIL